MVTLWIDLYSFSQGLPSEKLYKLYKSILFVQTLAMAVQTAVRHYSIPTHILEHQLQRDLRPLEL